MVTAAWIIGGALIGPKWMEAGSGLPVEVNWICLVCFFSVGKIHQRRDGNESTWCGTSAVERKDGVITKISRMMRDAIVRKRVCRVATWQQFQLSIMFHLVLMTSCNYLKYKTKFVQEVPSEEKYINKYTTNNRSFIPLQVSTDVTLPQCRRRW